MGGEFTAPASYPTVKLTLQYFLVFHITSCFSTIVSGKTEVVFDLQ